MEDENNDIIRWREWLEMELPYMYNQCGNFKYNMQMLNPNQTQGDSAGRNFDDFPLCFKWRQDCQTFV